MMGRGRFDRSGLGRPADPPKNFTDHTLVYPRIRPKNQKVDGYNSTGDLHGNAPENDE